MSKNFPGKADHSARLTPPRTGTPRRYITLAAAADRFACSERTLRRMIAAGELTGYRLGKRLVRLDADELDALARVIPTVGTMS